MLHSSVEQTLLRFFRRRNINECPREQCIYFLVGLFAVFCISWKFFILSQQTVRSETHFSQFTLFEQKNGSTNTIISIIIFHVSTFYKAFLKLFLLNGLNFIDVLAILPYFVEVPKNLFCWGTYEFYFVEVHKNFVEVPKDLTLLRYLNVLLCWGT